MASTPPPQTRNCQYCDKPLSGRSDKTFCDDSCRNNFNKQKRKAEKVQPHPSAKAIFRIIIRNYEILKSTHAASQADDDLFVFFHEKEMDPEFNPNFYTSIHYLNQSELWYFCFDQGWRKDGEHYYTTQLASAAKI
jgi:hypothetical protein